MEESYAQNLDPIHPVLDRSKLDRSKQDLGDIGQASRVKEEISAQTSSAKSQFSPGLQGHGDFEKVAVRTSWWIPRKGNKKKMQGLC
jgi:hypothetical protein